MKILRSRVLRFLGLSAVLYLSLTSAAQTSPDATPKAKVALSPANNGAAISDPNLPNAFRTITGPVQPESLFTFDLLNDHGQELRKMFLYPAPPLAAATPDVPAPGPVTTYYIWPFPQLDYVADASRVRWPGSPAEKMPSFVSAAAKEDDSDFDLYRVQIKVQFMSRLLMKSKDAIACIANRVQGVDTSKVQIDYFPVTHAYMFLEDKGRTILVADTKTITRTPFDGEVWFTATRPQIEAIDNAIRAGTMKMVWRFGFSSADAEIGHSKVMFSSSDIVTATAGIQAFYKGGSTVPLYSERGRDAIASRFRAHIWQEAVGNTREVLTDANIDTFVPQLFNHAYIDTAEFKQLVENPAQQAVLAAWLAPQIRMLRDEAAKHRMTVNTSTSSKTTSGGVNVGVSLPFLSFGGETANADEVVKGFTESSGVAYQRTSVANEYEPVALDLYALKEFAKDSEMSFTKKIYVLKGSDKCLYVEDSPVDLDGVNAYVAIDKRLEKEQDEVDRQLAEQRAKENAAIADRTHNELLEKRPKATLYLNDFMCSNLALNSPPHELAMSFTVTADGQPKDFINNRKYYTPHGIHDDRDGAADNGVIKQNWPPADTRLGMSIDFTPEALEATNHIDVKVWVRIGFGGTTLSQQFHYKLDKHGDGKWMQSVAQEGGHKEPFSDGGGRKFLDGVVNGGWEIFPHEAEAKR